MMLRFGYVVALGIVRAWAIMLTWAWFIRPVMAHHVHVGFVDALGLSLFVSLFTVNFSHADWTVREKIGDTAAFRRELVFSVSFYALVFLLALLVHALR